MTEIHDQKLQSVVQSLYRIRAAESPADADGIRTIWHQGGEGAELVSHVNREGRVVRQELTLLRDHLLWTSTKGVQTGSVSGESAGVGIKGSSVVSLDEAVDLEKINRIDHALVSYTGSDRYILHLRHVVLMVLSGQQEVNPSTVTSLHESGVHQALPPEAEGARAVVWIIAAAVALVAFAAGYLLFH